MNQIITVRDCITKNNKSEKICPRQSIKILPGIIVFQKEYYDTFLIFPTAKNAMKQTILVPTIVAPTGVDNNIDKIMPDRAHITDITTEHTVTLLKLLNTLIAYNAGNITRADIKSDPTRFIPMTIITAVTIAITRL